MIHAIHRPRPPLDAFVDFVWMSEEYVGRTARERVLPTGGHALVIHLADRPICAFADEHADAPEVVATAFLCGARTRPLVVGAVIGPTVGVHFKAGGARGWFDVPADALANRVAPLDALWGRAADELRARLVDAAAADRVRVIEDILLARPRADRPGAQLLAALAAFEDPDPPSVTEVNRRTGVSPKRLLALFRDQIGLGPKEFSRVRRFRRALRDLDRGLRGAEAAAARGYADQSHLLRDFRALAGSSVREYLAARIDGSDHVAIAAAGARPAGQKHPRRRDERRASLSA